MFRPRQAVITRHELRARTRARWQSRSLRLSHKRTCCLDIAERGWSPRTERVPFAALNPRNLSLPLPRKSLASDRNVKVKQGKPILFFFLILNPDFRLRPVSEQNLEIRIRIVRKFFFRCLIIICLGLLSKVYVAFKNRDVASRIKSAPG